MERQLISAPQTPAKSHSTHTANQHDGREAEGIDLSKVGQRRSDDESATNGADKPIRSA
jgi:hypothetical protein